jgi:hypothetical protein
MSSADKLLQTKLREKEIKQALKEKKQAEKEEKEEVRPASSSHINSCPISTLLMVNALVNMSLLLSNIYHAALAVYCAALAVACAYV